jgi:poly(3-hydroxybutyrate) depolymerase
MVAMVLVAVGGYVATTATSAAAATTAGCGKAPGLNSGTHTIQSSGKSRSFILRLPDSYNNTYPHRLAFGFHWLGGTADQVASGGTDGAPWAYYGMLSQSNNTTIFVAPQGISNGWGNSNGEDVTFTDDMIRTIENALCVDTTQRFSVGFSYGGAMSYSLACSRPTVFRAVAAIAAPGAISGCSGGTQPVAYMGIHGINDNIQSGRSLRDRFVRNNGCAPQNAPEPAAGSRTHTLTTYSCQAGYPVVWAAFDGGHQQGPVDGCAGCESGARSWVKPEVWRFFTQFSSTTPPTSPPPSSASPTTPPPTTPPVTTPPPTGDSCRVAYAVNAWNNGLTASITITNTATTAVNGWSLAFTLPSGQTITNGWNASYSPSSGAVTARNVSYNGSIAPNASVAIGFQATHAGNTARPTSFTLNGTACAIG